MIVEVAPPSAKGAEVGAVGPLEGNERVVVVGAEVGAVGPLEENERVVVVGNVGN